LTGRKDFCYKEQKDPEQKEILTPTFCVDLPYPDLSKLSRGATVKNEYKDTSILRLFNNNESNADIVWRCMSWADEHIPCVGKVKVKVKVKLSQCLTKHHAMKTYWGGGIAPRIPDLGTRR
jgi:hypothetical protein